MGVFKALNRLPLNRLKGYVIGIGCLKRGVYVIRWNISYKGYDSFCWIFCLCSADDGKEILNKDFEPDMYAFIGETKFHEKVFFFFLQTTKYATLKPDEPEEIKTTKF